MAEKIVSPGVFTNEVDQSFLPAGVAAIGAAVVGPTAKGPAGIPTIVSSYSEFVQIFGSKFSSGSGASENSYKYLTNYAAQEYLKYADTLTVVRVAPGAGPASVDVSSTVVSGENTATGSLTITDNSENLTIFVSSSTISETQFVGQASPNTDASDDSVRFFDRGSNVEDFINNFVTEFNAVSKFSAFTARNEANVRIGISGSSAGTSGNGLSFASGSGVTKVLAKQTEGGTDTSAGETVFTLTTLTDGADQNSFTELEGTNNTLASGSENNIRYEITSRNTAKGTFNMLIRRGDDTSRRI